jgi:hypothetical protein
VVVVTSSAGESAGRSLRDRVSDVLDPNGELRQMMDGVGALSTNAVLRPILADGGVDVDSWRERRREFDRLINIATHTMEFAVLGWAPSSQMNLHAYADALVLLGKGQSDEAEEVLTEAWDSEMLLRRAAHQVGLLGHPDQELNEPFRLRAELLYKAVDHHKAGSYEASILIVLAQIEGLVADVTGGKLFFSKSDQRKADIVAVNSLATLDEALPVVRDLFSQSQNVSGATGGLSRHGILHGRELGYQTRINSVKCFVLVQSLVDWAAPLVAEAVEQRRLAREAQWASADEVDERNRRRNRRRDRRGFRETCDLLTFLAMAHMGWYRHDNRYQDKTLGIASSAGPFHALSTPHGITLHISEDGRSWWAWRETQAGWVFGIGAVGEPPSQWFYDGPQPPLSGPGTDPQAWDGAPHTAGPNWNHS